jgi:bifunctional N-acetylglucosamine-1-phosphate-uridyltransferase/glucosamine-1-phosphate-acetyltransferase GlmU-like protein
MNHTMEAISLIFAAGKGSRMKSYQGNKTLLPLIPGETPFTGKRPILLHILENLPPGPKGLVVHHKKEDIIARTRDIPGITHCEQKTLDGTGGALLAAKSFIKAMDTESVIITMGDVPLVIPATYHDLLHLTDECSLAVLGFEPADKRRYGVLDIRGGRVHDIIEWTYWHTFPPDKQDAYTVCNSGIYAARRRDLLAYMDILEKHPHTVKKERNGQVVDLLEYFITDLVSLMARDGLDVGYTLARDPDEVMGIDDPASLQKAQTLFKARQGKGSDELRVTSYK